MPAPPHSLGHDHAQHAQLAQLLQRLPGSVLLVPFGGEGRQALGCELAQRVADHFLFLGEDHS
jgi:hypothetical protein